MDCHLLQIISDLCNQTGFVAADVEDSISDFFLDTAVLLWRINEFFSFRQIGVWKHRTHLMQRLEPILRYQIMPAAESRPLFGCFRAKSLSFAREIICIGNPILSKRRATIYPAMLAIHATASG